MRNAIACALGEVDKRRNPPELCPHLAKTPFVALRFLFCRWLVGSNWGWLKS